MSGNNNVFINFPFDKPYERMLISIISALVVIGRAPRCVLEITETGDGRLYRLQSLIEECPVSVHDLSRVGTPVRFNMPFELGLACGHAKYAKKKHHYLLLEKKSFRLDKTLSDLKGRDPLIHNGSPRKIINCILGAIGSPGQSPDSSDVYDLSEELSLYVEKLKKKEKEKTIFSRGMYLKVVEAALELATEKGFISAD